MGRHRKPASSELLACLFCDQVFITRGNLNVHLDRTLPVYRLNFGHTICPPDRLHHTGIIAAHRIPAGRPGIDVPDPDPMLALVLSEFARYTEYTTPLPTLPMRTALCEVNVLWWQAAVEEVLESFKKDADRDKLRRNVMALINSAKHLLAKDIGTGNIAINIESGIVAGDLVMKGAGPVIMTGCKIDRSVHDNRRSAFAESSSTAASRKRKGKQPAVWKDKDSDDDDDDDFPDEQTRFGSPSDATVERVDLTQVESSSSSSSSESDDDPPVRRRRRRLERTSSPDELSRSVPRSDPSVVIPATRRSVNPSVVIPKSGPVPQDIPKTTGPLFTLQVSILRRPAIALPVYGHETLDGIIRTAWKQAPKAVRSNADTKVMVSEDHGWSGVWSERVWADLMSAAGREVWPPVYSVVLEFEE